jgi:hypothetical protein
MFENFLPEFSFLLPGKKIRRIFNPQKFSSLIERRRFKRCLDFFPIGRAPVEPLKIETSLIFRHQLIQNGFASFLNLKFVAENQQQLRRFASFDSGDECRRISFHVASEGN